MAVRKTTKKAAAKTTVAKKKAASVTKTKTSVKKQQSAPAAAKKRTRPAKENAKKAAPAKKTAKSTATAATNKVPAKTVAAKAEIKPQPDDGLDLSALPPESVMRETRWVCLACVLDIYTRNFGFSPAKAKTELKAFAPQVSELEADVRVRPYFDLNEEAQHCPYCDSSKRWHAPLRIIRIESGPASDAPRRALIKSLPASQSKFEVLEQKATQREAFFQWLEKLGHDTDFERPGWLKFVAKHYLARRMPKEDWHQIFNECHSVRRSRRLEEGFETDNGRLFLAPSLFDEVLVVQYLVSRSQKAGGLTFEGRLTLHELIRRLRGAGTLREFEVTGADEGEIFEHLINHLGGGEDSLRFYYILDRREFLDALEEVKDAASVPKPSLKLR